MVATGATGPPGTFNNTGLIPTRHQSGFPCAQSATRLLPDRFQSFPRWQRSVRDRYTWLSNRLFHFGVSATPAPRYESTVPKSALQVLEKLHDDCVRREVTLSQGGGCQDPTANVVVDSVAPGVQSPSWTSQLQDIAGKCLGFSFSNGPRRRLVRVQRYCDRFSVDPASQFSDPDVRHWGPSCSKRSSHPGWRTEEQ